MKKTFSISFQTIFYYVVIIGFLFPRGYNDMNKVYHIIGSVLMWIAVILTWIQWFMVRNDKKKTSVQITTLLISGYFIAAIIITAICRKNFSSGLQQLFAAPSVCVFMISNLKQAPQKLLNIIINILCIEFTINIVLSLSDKYLNGIYHMIFLGHVQVVSQYGILALLISILFLLLYHTKKKKIIYLLIITFYIMLTTDAQSALFTVVGLAIAFIIYRLKGSQLLMFRSEFYVAGMIILSGVVVYLSAINTNILPNFDINGRHFVWQNAIEKIIVHPFVGYGIDGVQLSTFWTNGFNYAHNQLVQNLIDGGVILAIFFWIMIFAFSSKINKINIMRYKVLCNAILIALLFVMIFDSTTLYIYMYMILSICYDVEKIEKMYKR